MKKIAVVLAGAAMMIGFATMANATSILLSDGINPTLIVNDGSALDLNPIVGAVTFLGSYGAWTLNVSTGISKPAIGSANTPSMDLSSVNTGIGGLQIAVSDTNFTLKHANWESAIGGTIGKTNLLNGALMFQTFFDTTNQLFNGSSLSTLGPFSPGAFSGSANVFEDINGPYSLTELITINHKQLSTTSFDASLNGSPVPEPGTMMLLGIGMLGLAVYGKRRMNKDA